MIPAMRLGLISAAMLASGAAIGLSLSGGGTPADPVPHVAQPVSPDALLRGRIVADYRLAGDAARFEVADYAAADLDRLVRTRIDPALLKGAVSKRGQDLRFTPADGVRRHAGVIVIRYPDAATAADRVRPLLGGKRFFNDTKILTPMVAAARGDMVAIFFTESGGDPMLRTALSHAANAFQSPV
ncbi:hypothetical protein TPR58_16810 [Sphingomonas sp. HF-S3]|uniref:Uncharacterized protein n=1 Tax=Sphingomonas rustica TaxID=3103142 RepID=A0ABV0BB82_9SPHN